MIEIKGLRKSFGKKKQVIAVDDVSLTCHDGCITGLLGPNGSGKTTLLRMAAGLMLPNSGSVEIDGTSVLDDSAGARAKIGLQSDMKGIYTWLSPREQLQYYGRFYGIRPPELEQRVNTIIEDLNMKAYADRYAHGFSLGQRQKIILGRALIHDPKNIIFDEPTNGLDMLAVREVRDLIFKLKERGRCVLFSTHYMDEAERLCDIANIIVNGKIIATGSPKELMAKTGTTNFDDAVTAIVNKREMVYLDRLADEL